MLGLPPDAVRQDPREVPPVSARAQTILDLLELERIDRDLFRACATTGESVSLYGGQVAAQALRAAGLTVDPRCRPHSLHGYFLRKGDSAAPTVFQVHRDRDGRSFQARRVVALQDGEVIFSMAASFQDADEESAVSQVEPAPVLSGPEGPVYDDFLFLVSTEVRVPEQPHPSALWPTRAWVRFTVDLPEDPLLHACLLAYLSDMTTGNLPSADGARPGPSIDHAVWFHAAADMARWTLVDCHPRAAGGGRGWYVGSVFDDAGGLLASLAQESLLRVQPAAPGTGE